MQGSCISLRHMCMSILFLLDASLSHIVHLSATKFGHVGKQHRYLQVVCSACLFYFFCSFFKYLFRVRVLELVFPTPFVLQILICTFHFLLMLQKVSFFDQLWVLIDIISASNLLPYHQCKYKNLL